MTATPCFSYDLMQIKESVIFADDLMRLEERSDCALPLSLFGYDLMMMKGRGDRSLAFLLQRAC